MGVKYRSRKGTYMNIYHMTDIIPLLGLPYPPNERSSYYITCPCCDSGPGRKKHLNINLAKDVFRCPRCGFSGGVFDLYAYYTGIKRDDVYHELNAKFDRDGAAQRNKEKIKMSEIPKITEYPAIDIVERDITYRTLLARIPLASDHKQNLVGRGLTEKAVEEKGYRTTPVVGTITLAKQLLSGGCYLAGVPGFHRTAAGEWTFVSNKRGILIPVRDIQGRIQGLQVRRDNVNRRKFRWVSSAGRPDGCKAEGWVHFAGPVREQILLIEGPMKADVLNHLTGQTVLAVPGVNTLTQLEMVLTELKTLGAQKIMTCFDMDFLKNHHVQNGYNDLIHLLDRMGYKFGTYLWPPDYNGLDDYVWEYCIREQTA